MFEDIKRYGEEGTNKKKKPKRHFVFLSTFMHIKFYLCIKSAML